MFNIIDLIVIAVLFFAVYVGYKKGFVKTAIKLVSFFVAIALAVMFYKPLAVILTENTVIDDWIVENMTKTIEEEITDNEKIEVDSSKDENVSENEENTNTEDVNGDLHEKIEEENINLVDVFRHLPTTLTENFNLEEIKNEAKEDLAYQISELIMKLLSLIIIYVVVKVTLSVASFVLDGIMQIPILKQLNEMLGMCLGAILGFIQVYISFAVITFISSICDIEVVIEMIKSSAFASVLFENNLIIQLLF